MSQIRAEFMRIFQNYRFKSIFFSNLVLMILTILFPFLCSVLICYYSYNMIANNERMSYSNELLSRISRDVDDLFKGLMEQSIMMAFEKDIELFYIQRNAKDNALYDLNEIYNRVVIYNMVLDELDTMYLYAPYSGSIITPKGLFEYENFEDKECLDRWNDVDRNFRIEYLKRNVGEKQKENICLYYISYQNAECRGVTVFQLDAKKIAEMLDYGEQVRVFIANNRQVLFDSKNMYTGSDSMEIEHIAQLEDEIIVSKVLDEMGLKIILHVSSSEIEESLNRIKLVIGALICFMIVITLWLVFHISIKLYNPFHEIMDFMQEKDMESYKKKIFENDNELAYIKKNFYETWSRAQNAEAELQNRLEMLRKAQAVALQSQINAHFINNILENMHWKIVKCMGKGNEVSLMLNSLSTLLRATLENTDTFVTLRDELEYVKRYVFLQQILLSNKFELKVNIPKDLEQCGFMKLLLQPVVENAIKYGIKPYGGMGILEIKVTRREDKLCILVKDSGLGIDKEEVVRINESISLNLIKESNHIGLSNVNQRIKLAFGNDFGVTLSSEIGEGTTVALIVPFREMKRVGNI